MMSHNEAGERGGRRARREEAAAQPFSLIKTGCDITEGGQRTSWMSFPVQTGG